MYVKNVLHDYVDCFFFHMRIGNDGFFRTWLLNSPELPHKWYYLSVFTVFPSFDLMNCLNGTWKDRVVKAKEFVNFHSNSYFNFQ